MNDDGLWDGIQKELAGSARVAVIGIGDECSPADRLGIYAARMLRDSGVPAESIFLAGTVPESVTAPVRRYRPDCIILLDAAEMGLRPGTIAPVTPGTIGGTLLSSHALPLSAVMEYLALDTSAEVVLLGIQPNLLLPGGLSPGDREFLDRNIGRLAGILKETGSRSNADVGIGTR